jgi:AcrR family transcriptional regulator
MKQRDVIIETAVQLFKKKGYPATSMQDIAKEINCTKAAIYYYFSGKEEILMTIMEQAMTIAEDKMAQILTEELTPPQMLKAIIFGHMMAVFEEQAYITVFFFDKHYLSDENLGIIHLRRRQYEEKIAEVVKQGIDEGYLEPTEVLPVVYGILGMCNWMIQWYQPNGKLKPEEITDIYWQLISKGIIKN